MKGGVFKITIKEFQEKYHDYTNLDGAEAAIDAMKLRVIAENGKEVPVVAVKIGDKYCLMLKTAVEALRGVI